MTEQEQRTARSFISTIGVAFGLDDQSLSTTDGQAVNPPRQYQVIGQNGTQTEGSSLGAPPTSADGLASVAKSPIMWIGLGLCALAAFYVLKK